MDLKQYRAKLVGDADERAVSPVIGVILMVAIVTILAAVIAAFVLGMADDLGGEAQAGVDLGSDGDTASATWQSEGNSDSIDVDFAIVDADNDTSEYTLKSGDDDVSSVSGKLEEVSDRETVTVYADSGTTSNIGDEVTVEIIATANSEDTSTVVQDTEVTVVVEETA